MTKEKRCADLVNGKYKERFKEIKKAYNNKNLDFHEWLSQFGLGWDYVCKNTFNDQKEGYYRWQLSWGGGSDEFRIYTDEAKNISHIEYWYLDWFDGASINVDDEEVISVIQWQLEADKSPVEYEGEEMEVA